jgi:YD repeat-containing protein
MKRLPWILALLVFFSCKKSKDTDAIRLRTVESIDYMGNAVYTKYSYDHQGRITSITENKANEQPVTLATISYNGNEAVLLSSYDDPSYKQTKELRLTLDATGKLLKRIEYTYRVNKAFLIKPAEEFRYDTMAYEYDAAGLLKKATGNRQDSAWLQPDHTVKRQFISTINYTNSGNNITAMDEYVTYPYATTLGGVTTISGGSSEYHRVFNYTKAFPNGADFKNAAVLNEYKFYFYEPPLNSNYKNMPDQIGINNIDKDLNGTVIFTGKGTVDVERIYNPKGLQSTINLLSGNTHQRKINFFYSW